MRIVAGIKLILPERTDMMYHVLNAKRQWLLTNLYEGLRPRHDTSCPYVTKQRVVNQLILRFAPQNMIRLRLLKSFYGYFLRRHDTSCPYVRIIYG